ncbi:hypothetical protein [Larkinella rosea]|uniref:Tubulin/FtsZ GTPase domain-containing protein n=1 Tax=Larkinella rosea TaxID=2025312 RepID=A0A3P1BUY6_9BACT|nr:hypothetical protein [Larkinella rosea]RRB04374.1 hypothetical protein EHT25_12785 [Larkinella rosea]
MEDEDYFAIIGIGATGGAVLEKVYQSGMRNCRFVVCLEDVTALNASYIPAKIRLAGNEAEVGQAEQRLTEEISRTIESTELVFIVAELNDAGISRTATLVAQQIRAMNRRCVAIVAAAANPAFPLAVPDEATFQVLSSLCDGLMAVRSTGAEPDTSVHAMTSAIRGLVAMCRASWDTVDFSDVAYVMRGTGRMAVVEQEADGEQRSEAVLAGIINQLAAFPFALRSVDRILLHLSGSPANPVRMREQYTLVKGLTDQIGSQPRLFKTVYSEDGALEDRLKMTVLLWTPV